MKKFICFLFALSFFITLNPLALHAAGASLSVTSNNDDSMQVSVFAALPNSAVTLRYVSGSLTLTLNIGSTNSQGVLNTTVSSGRNNIVAGSGVTVIVGGQQSNVAIWPDYGNIGVLNLTTLGLFPALGQTAIDTASVGSNLYVANNSNPLVASVSINGSQVNVTGTNNGITNIIVCATSLGCRTIYVLVGPQNNQTSIPVVPSTQTSQTQQIQPSISLSQGSLTMDIGQNQVVSVSGAGSFGISANSNIQVALANLSGSTLSIQALSAGTTNVSVCAVGTTTLACGGLTVTVNAPVVDTTQSTGQNISLSETDIRMDIGQNHSISISGAGGFYLSQNSSDSIVSANVSGSTLYLNALKSGGTNVTVCQQAAQCASVYVYVSPSSGQGVAQVIATSLSFSKYLYSGMTKVGVADADVLALQKRLTTDNLYSGPITGYFGPLTKAAVIAYQKKFGLSPVGVVGPSTRALLNQGK